MKKFQLNWNFKKVIVKHFKVALNFPQGDFVINATSKLFQVKNSEMMFLDLKSVF